MANPFDALVDWVESNEIQTRARRDRNVVDLLNEGFRLVADAIDYRYTISPEQLVLSAYDAEPARAQETNLHGGLLSLSTADAVDTVPTTYNVSKGIGKILFVVNAGTDLSGTLTVSGTVVDRETGASGADTDDVAIEGLSTDNSTTDGNGNTVHDFRNAYITSKWFHGTVTMSTSDLTISDIDTYHVSFEQFNDVPYVRVQTFDINALITNAGVELDAYLYALTVSGSTCNITNEADLHVGTDGFTGIANKYERLRRGNIGKSLVTSHDGVWVDVFYSNPASAYVEDLTIKIWADRTLPQSATGALAARPATMSNSAIRVSFATGALTSEVATISGEALWASASAIVDLEADIASISGTATRYAIAAAPLAASPVRVAGGISVAIGSLVCAESSLEGHAFVEPHRLIAGVSTVSGSATVTA